MRTLITLSCSFLTSIVSTTILTAQPVTDAEGDVGIGTRAPDPSAVLDIRSTSKGLVIPRVTTTMRDNIALPATGLMIYNSESNEFQYNFGTPQDPEWVRVITDSSLENIFSDDVWMLSGNGGTTPFDGVSGDFLGTTDDVDLVLGTGGTAQGRFLSPANGGGFELAGPFQLNGSAGTSGQVLVSQGAGVTPLWTSDLSVDNIVVGGDVTIAGNTTVNGDADFNGAVDFANLPAIPLPQGNLLVGDGTNRAVSFSPGSSGQVLQIDGSGQPAWQDMNVLPTGTTLNSFLVWDGTTWVENTNVTSDPGTGNTTIGGSLTVGGGVTLPAGSIDNSELANAAINVSYGTGLNGDASVALGGTLNLQNTGVTSVAGTANQVNVSGATGGVTFSLPQNIDPNATPTFDGIVLDNLSGASTATEVIMSSGGTLQTRSINSLLGAATLTQNSLWIGDAGNNPMELSGGLAGQVLQISGSGAPAWQSVGTVPTGTGTNTVLVWDGAAWVENPNVTSDPGTGNTTIGGSLTVVGGVTLPAGSIDNGELANSSINLSYGIGISGDASVGLGGTLNLTNTGVTSVAGTANQVNVSGATGGVTFSLPQNIDPNATPTFDGIVLDNLSGGSTATEVIMSSGGTLQTRSINSLLGAATLTQNNLWVGNAANNPSELSPGLDGQVLSIVGGVPTWSSATPASTDVVNSSTTDEAFAMRGTASGGTANQVSGIWGRATDPSSGNTGTIGLFATGNGNTTAGETNAALQLNDGELRVGRTTETGTGYTVVESATGGTAYSAEGPSGVIEFALTLANNSPLAGALVGVLNTLGTPLGAPTLGTTLNSVLGASVFNATVTINNRYVTSESIIIAQMLSLADTDPVEDLASLFQNGTLTASTAITNRQTGSFDLTIDLRSLGPTPTINNGEIRVGYLVVNPSR